MLLVAFAVATLAMPFYRPHLAQYLSNKSNIHWTPGIPEVLANYTYDEIIGKLLRIHHLRADNQPRVTSEVVTESSYNPDNGPSRLDYRETRPECFFTPEDQAHCSSCYAFATLGALSARRCIAGLDEKAIPLSVQHLISCDDSNGGCSGGQFSPTWEFLRTKGAVSRECLPYTSGMSNIAGKCPEACVDGTPLSNTTHFFAVSAAPLKSYNDIMESLVNDGPVQTGFYVYEDFMYYVGGIYHKVYGSSIGAHAVVIVGYGEMGNIKYWIVRNSWGPKWGEDGYFRILRANNECGIEDNAWKVEVK